MKLFNAANKLNDYTITIGDIELIKEVIISVEIAYTNSTPKILSKIIIDDLYDLNLQQEWHNSTVEIKYTDIFKTETTHDFVILNIVEKSDIKNDKFFIINLQDKFSYTLEHSFISKSFKTNIITCINKYIEQLNLEYTTDFSTSSNSYNFVIPNHINNLDAFLIEICKKGYSFYQTRDLIVIKSIADLLPSKLTYNGLYKDETDNQLYMNKIIEMTNVFNDRDSVPPITRALAYNLLTKTITSLKSNEITNYVLNTDSTNPQDTSGERYLYQIHTDFNQNTKEMKDDFFSRAEIEIVINGYNKNDLNQIYELELKGNKASPDLHSKGNQIINGKYISTKIIDKIVSDSMIQKITLSRADITKWN